MFQNIFDIIQVSNDVIFSIMGSWIMFQNISYIFPRKVSIHIVRLDDTNVKIKKIIELGDFFFISKSFSFFSSQNMVIKLKTHYCLECIKFNEKHVTVKNK